MSWAASYIEALQQGRTVSFRPRGHSMRGRVESGQRVTVVPVDAATDLSVGDVVLCHVRGHDYLHLIRATRGKQADAAERWLIGNNGGGINGWIGRNKIFGRLSAVE